MSKLNLTRFTQNVNNSHSHPSPVPSPHPLLLWQWHTPLQTNTHIIHKLIIHAFHQKPTENDVYTNKHSLTHVRERANEFVSVFCPLHTQTIYSTMRGIEHHIEGGKPTNTHAKHLNASTMSNRTFDYFVYSIHAQTDWRNTTEQERKAWNNGFIYIHAR